ncbi:MAG: gluconate 2-dehydrogenase subunit 3 family protein [Anaerolineae bacterium]|nr:MAG: gluconate 2-dehydrogenase subunit 3 family protein [Anaerolineae bacterium]
MDNGAARPITRRGFLKRAAVIGAAVGGTAILGAGGKLWWDDNTRQTILATRNQQRPTGSTQWLIQPEYVLLAALASILLPSDDRGPGAPEAAVVDTIDRLIATTPRQARYGPGLLAFDERRWKPTARSSSTCRASQEALVEGSMPWLPPRHRRRPAQPRGP